jgi:LPXTG-motif cell wall-anchored protein
MITVQTKDGKHTATAKVTVKESVSPSPVPVENNNVEEPKDSGQYTEVKNENGSTQNGNHKLPDTATSHYNLIVIGLLLVLLSGIAFIVKRKSAMEE